MSIRDAGQVRGNPNNDSTLRSDLAYNEATAQRIGSGRVGLDVVSNTFGQLVASDAVEAASTTSVINATAHVALAGDWIAITSGTLSGQVFTVYSVSTNAITLAQTASSAPAAAVTFDILRPSVPRVSSAGVVSTAASISAASKTGQTPNNASVTTSSTQIVASNSSRTGLILTNIGSDTVYLAIGQTALLSKGFALLPLQSWEMALWTFSTGAVNGISASGTNIVAFQELQ